MDAAIAEYFQAVYGNEDQEIETDEDRLMWERFTEAAEATRGMFTTQGYLGPVYIGAQRLDLAVVLQVGEGDAASRPLQ